MLADDSIYPISVFGSLVADDQKVVFQYLQDNVSILAVGRFGRIGLIHNNVMTQSLCQTDCTLMPADNKASSRSIFLSQLKSALSLAAKRNVGLYSSPTKKSRNLVRYDLVAWFVGNNRDERAITSR